MRKRCWSISTSCFSAAGSGSRACARTNAPASGSRLRRRNGCRTAGRFLVLSRRADDGAAAHDLSDAHVDARQPPVVRAHAPLLVPVEHDVLDHHHRPRRDHLAGGGGRHGPALACGRREPVGDRIRVRQPAIERRRARRRRGRQRRGGRGQRPRRGPDSASPVARRDRLAAGLAPGGGRAPRLLPCAYSRRSFFSAADAPPPSPPASSRSGGASGSGLGAIVFTHSRHCFSVNVASLRSNFSVSTASLGVLLVGQPPALVRLGHDPVDVLVPLGQRRAVAVLDVAPLRAWA